MPGGPFFKTNHPPPGGWFKNLGRMPLNFCKSIRGFVPTLRVNPCSARETGDIIIEQIAH